MTQGGDRKSSSQDGNLKNARTSELVAKEHRMGKESVLRAAKFSKGVDAAEKIERNLTTGLPKVNICVQ